ncbi:MAG TPA: GNAT family protein [Terracidiphilus sp.]|nr:GNAT family protein [Terracidiphilus sp.]
MDSVKLTCKHIELVPLDYCHAEALTAAAAADPSLYQWSAVPLGKEAVEAYIAKAVSWREAGSAVPFATVRRSDGAVIGSTRFFDIERWAWPAGHGRHGRSDPDACEIGYTWLTRSAIRTAANTEAKFLMLQHAFEKWKVLRVCLHTDARNERSQAAIERVGGKFEGVLRAHRMATDYIARDSYRYSIIAAEWPELKIRLSRMLEPEVVQQESPA